MEITVNEETIPASLFEQERDRLHMDPNSPPYEELGDIVRDTLVARTLIRQAAQKKDFEIPDSEIADALEDLIKDAGSKDLFYRRYGIDDGQEDLVKEEIRVTLKVERLIQEISQNAAEPARNEIEAYYEEHGAELIEREETEAMHIVMSPHCEHEAAETYEAMREIRTRLLEGADFEGLAAANSTHNDDGGCKLGWFSRGNMVPEFETIAFSMTPGEISPVFQTQFGYHIVKITGRKEEKRLTLEEARPRIVEALLQDKKNALIEEWVDEEKKKAEITVAEAEAGE